MPNTALDIIAYYLSEYDLEASKALGYSVRNTAFDKLAPLFGRNGNYLRRLRDEFDVVTNSTRKGQRNRVPLSRISQVAKALSTLSFETLTEMVVAIVDNASVNRTGAETHKYDLHPLSEDSIEQILNAKDANATVEIKTSDQSIRKYNTRIIDGLKKLYDGRCQLCGSKPLSTFSEDICEAHHIDYFANSHNNDASNILILCPNHHRLIHKLNPHFDITNRCFVFPDGQILKLKIDLLQEAD